MSFKFLNQGQSGNIQQFTPIDTFIDPVSKIRVSNPSNLIDTDFEYGLQPTKWETVELINNTPAFFSKGGDTTIPDITGITTNAGTREITVTTAFPHNLAVGIPIRVSGTKSVTADGSYIINATPTITTFTYLSRANQPETISIFDLYSSIITGEFFQGSQISINDSDGMTTDAEGPISTITVKTENNHGFGRNTPFYFLNLNSTISQEFESTNNSSLSFDPTNSATAQSFDGSNTLLQTPVDLSNSATTSIFSSQITSTTPIASTVSVSIPTDDRNNWGNLRVGSPLYYSVQAGSGYFQANPRGIVFIKNVDQINVVNGTATFQLSQFPNGAALAVLANMTGFFRIADQARTFPGNNVDVENQIELSLFRENSFVFDGGNQGYDGELSDPPNNSSEVFGYSGSNISIFSSEGILDYYPGAMLKYTTNGTPPGGLQNNTTYFVKTFAPGPGGGAGLYVITLCNYPGEDAIIVDGAQASGSQIFNKIGVSTDKNIIHVKNSSFVTGDLIEYIPPTGGRFTADINQNYYFIKKAYDIHNYELNDNPFIPIVATGGTVSEAFYDGRIYRTHTFTSTGTSSFIVQDLGTDPDVEFLVVGGGGSGGNAVTTNANGGGGGGGILYSKKHRLQQNGVISVTVGNGGAGLNFQVDTNGNNGENSAFGNFIAFGGGGGANGRSSGATRDGKAGGSGGGSGWGNTGNEQYNFNTGVTTQRPVDGALSFGNDGGFTSITWTGAGGGGASETAQLSSLHGGRGAIGNNSVAAAWGGFGASFDIQGRPVFYAGGGGGGGNTSERSGEGMHGGGRGFGTTSSYNHTEYDLSDPPVAVNGSQGGSQSLHARANTGGGGGASSYWSNNTSWGTRTSGRGGSGIVIVRYPITAEPEFKIMQATGGDVVEDVVSPDGAWRVHKFLTPGTTNFNVTETGSHGVQFLVVAGGGAGGNGVTTNANGGGGGGGVVHSTSYRINASGTIPVTVGQGGIGSVFQRDVRGENGLDSSFGTFIARGGGGGGGRGSGTINAANGGSSGGYAFYNSDNTNASPTQQFVFDTPDGSASGFGNRGGRRGQQWTGAGGGGAGSQGHDGNYQSEPLRSADGGYGYLCTIEGQRKFYSGGGGGGGNSSERAGSGWHGGGRGFARTTYYDFNEYPAEGTINPITLGSATLNAVNNTGGGGGATSYWSNNTSWGTRGAGSGGHGIVVVRYRIIPPEFLGFEARMIARGGEEKDIVVEDGGFAQLYRTHTFKYTGTNNFTIENMGRIGDGQVEYLIVAGGGGGGSDMGGGGGAGGLLQGKIPISIGEFPVTVGIGGVGAVGYNNFPPPGNNGGNSSFAGLVAIGGGGGSSGHYYQPGSSYVGAEARDGGSGGGGSAAYFNQTLGRPPGQGTPGQGTAGGFGKYFPNGQYGAGAGGGAGGNQDVNAIQGSRSGDGGPGVISDIMGYPFYFAGGGGGAGHNEGFRAGNGGLGGGAPGSRWRQEGEQSRFRGREGYGGLNASTVANYEFDYHRHGAMAGPNTGSGGGGAMHQGRGGAGGSGIVVIRYPISTKRRLPQ